MPDPTPAYLKRQQEKNPVKIDLKIKLLQFLVTKAGVAISGITAAIVTALLAFMASKLGVDLRNDPEMTGALLLFVNQTIWGLIQWAVNRYEFAYKKELQSILGGGIAIDGLIGAQTVQRAQIVKEFAESSDPLPHTMK